MVKEGDKVAELVAEFAREVANQTDAIWKGDAKTGNKHAKRYMAVFRKLTAMGDLGREALVPLLDHERPDVRVTTAAYLLRYRTSEAMAVLLEAARGSKGLTAFEASAAI